MLIAVEVSNPVMSQLFSLLAAVSILIVGGGY
jgi:hypothetical protein